MVRLIALLLVLLLAMSGSATEFICCCDTPSVRDSWGDSIGTDTTTFRIQFYLLLKDDGSDTIITEAGIDSHMVHVAAAFDTLKFSFDYDVCYIRSTRYYYNSGMFCHSAFDQYPDMQLQLWIDSSQGGSCAYAPWTCGHHQPGGGISLSEAHMDDSTDSETIIHELGHIFGLRHPFWGVDDPDGPSACDDGGRDKVGLSDEAHDTLGDFDCQTAPMPYVTDGADSILSADSAGAVAGYNWDTCYAGEDSSFGLVPIHNFMGYCHGYRDRFTSNQYKRMLCYGWEYHQSWMMPMMALDDPLQFYDIGATNGVLSIPRRKVWCPDSGQALIFPKQHGSGSKYWLYTDGDTWDTLGYGTNNGRIDALDYYSDHAHTWYAQGIHTVFESQTGHLHYRYIEPPCSDTADRQAAIELDDGTASYYPSVVAADSEEVWVAFRSELGLIRAFHTTDGFSTWETDSTVSTISDDVDDLRIGMMLDADGDAILVVFQYGTGYQYFRWDDDSTAFVTPSDYLIVDDAGLGAADRSYSHVLWDDKITLIFSERTAADSTTIMCISQDGEGGWDSEVISAFGDMTDDGLFAHPVACVRNDSIFCAYNIGEGADRQFVLKIRDADGWAADSTTLTPGDVQPQYLQMPPYVGDDWPIICAYTDDTGSPYTLYAVWIRFD